jgi:hypothetical protein
MFAASVVRRISSGGLGAPLGETNDYGLEV